MKIEAKINDDSTQIAVKTDDNVTMPWFVFIPHAGGYYATEDEVKDMRDIPIPEPAIRDEVG